MAVLVHGFYKQGETHATRAPDTEIAWAFRVRVVLACAEGKSNTAVAAAQRLCKPTVGKRRGGLVGNLDVARPGASREIDTPR
jgi:hypothetical protein